MIPKVIHYIWLGGNPLPKIAKKCIKSWKKYCPNYEIKRWDETNLNLNLCPYVQKAYDQKKYAFSSDVFRFEILKNEGGIYLDIDVELIKPIDDLLNNEVFMGFESEQYVAPGLILGSVPNNRVIAEIREKYSNLDFEISKNNKTATVCVIVTDILKKYGLELKDLNQKLSNGIMIYNTHYFCPKSVDDGKVRISDETYSIHHYLATWRSGSQKFKNNIKKFIKRILGEKLTNKIKQSKENKTLNRNKDEK